MLSQCYEHITFLAEDKKRKGGLQWWPKMKGMATLGYVYPNAFDK
jgi:hypothetical protein